MSDIYVNLPNVNEVKLAKYNLAKKNLETLKKAKKELLGLKNSFKNPVHFNMCFIGLDNLKKIYEKGIEKEERDNMPTLPYPRKEFTVQNTQQSIRVLQHFIDDKPRTICVFEKFGDIDYKGLAELVADKLNEESDW